MDYEPVTKEIRKQIFLSAYGASIAHLASAFSIVEVLYVLYDLRVLRYDPHNPEDPRRDWLILSKGHGSLALYHALFRCGFLSEEAMETFSKPGTCLGGEPCYPLTSGVECSTGSLGHGLGFAVGVAKAKKLDHHGERVFCLVGDGECEEGSNWEAVQFAVHQKLDNLVILVDANGLQKMDSLERVAGIHSLAPRFQVMGCEVREIDGHCIPELQACLTKENRKDTPLVVILRTVKGKGVSCMENDPDWHWRLPKKKELKYFIKDLGITEEELEHAKSLRGSAL